MRKVLNPIIRRIGPGVLALVLSFAGSASALVDVVPIVSAKSPITSLSRNGLLDIFLGRALHFPDGGKAVAVDQEEGSAAREEFYAKFGSKTPAQLKAYWSKMIFTGRGKPPMAVPSGIETRSRVAADPQVIGYIERTLLDSSVKVVRVD